MAKLLAFGNIYLPIDKISYIYDSKTDDKEYPYVIEIGTRYGNKYTRRYSTLDYKNNELRNIIRIINISSQESEYEKLSSQILILTNLMKTLDRRQKRIYRVLKLEEEEK